MSQDLKGEHIYVNALVVAGDDAKLAYYHQTFNDSILKKGSKYTLSIDRFRIPMDDIYIFRFNSATNAYTVELEYNGVFSGRTPVVYIPTTTNYTSADAAYWSVWTFDIFVRMVNNALATAFASLAGLTTLPTGALAPFFTFDPTTKEIAYNAQSNFYDYSLALPIKLYMNQRLWKFFDGIPILVVGQLYHPSVANGRDVIFLAFNTFDNSITYGTAPNNQYYHMVSDNGFECIASWNVAKGFYFRSNNIPVRNEIMPNIEIISGVPTLNNNVSSQPIICNFDFAFSESAPKPQIAQYILSTPYKIMDIISSEGLRTLDLQVFWYDKYNNSYPLSIRPNDAMTMRLVFQEKI